jgi:hypothetical protein
MLRLDVDRLKEYLSSVYKANVEIRFVGELGKEEETYEKELKGFGYGVPYLIEFSVDGKAKCVVLETMRTEGGFGHDHFSDRAQVLLWQHSAFGKLPKHVKSVDVGAFTVDNGMKTLGDCKEFFIVTELIDGVLYHNDLDRIKMMMALRSLDEERCIALADYLAEIHEAKRDEPQLYVRRVRDLVGHGEGIMGLMDSYPPHLQYISEKDLCEIEKKCVDWRWRLKRMTHRLCQVHGDYHPWNIMFREGVDFTVLDRSRGEWGEPADDVTALTINYVFYSLQTYSELAGPFETLWKLFWKNYLDRTGDEEMLTVVQPYFAWRGLVVASPVWYPNLPLNVRTKLFNFIKKVLKIDQFDITDVNSYIKG